MPGRNAGSSQPIEELQKRFQGLEKQKIQIETQRDHALKQLNELKATAKEQYGSDDVGELKKKLKEMEESNEEKRTQYQTSLDTIDEDLAAISEKFSEEEEVE